MRDQIRSLLCLLAVFAVYCIPCLIWFAKGFAALAGLCVAVLLVIAGIVSFIRWVQEGYTEAELEDRHQRGCCLRCGYRLRRNVSGICPECGEPVGAMPSTDRVTTSAPAPMTRTRVP